MTLAEVQPFVEAAITALEWNLARARWRNDLIGEADALARALPLAGSYGVEAAPIEARLAQIAIEAEGDVTADRVPQHPIRSVPMDMVTVAVIRRVLRIPQTFPVLAITTLPPIPAIEAAVADIAQRWRDTRSQAPDDVLTHV